METVLAMLKEGRGGGAKHFEVLSLKRLKALAML